MERRPGQNTSLFPEVPCTPLDLSERPSRTLPAAASHREAARARSWSSRSSSEPGVTPRLPSNRTAVPSSSRSIPRRTCSLVILLSPSLSASRSAPSSAFFALGEKGMRRPAGMRMSKASPASRRTSSSEIPTEESASANNTSDSSRAASRLSPSEESASTATPPPPRSTPSSRSSSPTESWPSNLASSSPASTHRRASLAKRLKITRPSPFYPAWSPVPYPPGLHLLHHRPLPSQRKL